jgi:hypothetical protein
MDSDSEKRMGTQVSKTAGILKLAVQRREVQRKLRQEKDVALAAEVEKAKGIRAQQVEESREERVVAGAPDVSSFEAPEAYRTNINQKQKIQEMAEDSVSPGEAVREMYGLNDPLQVLAQNNARQDELGREREISIKKQKATIIAASEEREITNARYEAGNKKDMEDNLRRQAEKIIDLERDLNLAEERKGKEALAELSQDVGSADERKAIFADIEADLVKVEKALAVDNKAQAKLAARDVALGEKQLKKAFASKQFAARQIQANRPKDTTEGAFEGEPIAPSGQPETTLGLVASKEESSDTKEAREANRREEREPAEPIFLTPNEVRMDTAEELQETREKVAQALETSRTLGAESEKVGNATKKLAKKIMRSIDASIPGERLPGPEEASKAAEEAARITVDDPLRALQSQALISIDTAMRVLR